MLILYQRPSDKRWEWHALLGKVYIAVSPCSFASRASAKRSANRCVASFKKLKTTVTWGK